MSIHFMRLKSVNNFNTRYTIMRYDILLLIMITTLGYSPRNPLYIIRKIVLNSLLFKLNNIFRDETFWVVVITMSLKKLRNETLEGMKQIILNIVTLLYHPQLPKHYDACWILDGHLMIFYSAVVVFYIHRYVAVLVRIKSIPCDLLVLLGPGICTRMEL